MLKTCWRIWNNSVCLGSNSKNGTQKRIYTSIWNLHYQISSFINRFHKIPALFRLPNLISGFAEAGNGGTTLLMFIANAMMEESQCPIISSHCFVCAFSLH